MTRCHVPMALPEEAAHDDPFNAERLATLVDKTVEEITVSGDDDELVDAPLRVAYQGVPGAYSEMAALKALPHGEPYPCAQFETAFQTVSQWMADRAVLPVENSLGGSIHTVYDLLLRYRLHIVGETSVSVDHCLLALPGVKVSDVKRVISHPQALAQCDGYLRDMGVVREAVDDTAGAAMEISKQGWRDTAAIASYRAGDLYGMERLDTSIQDNKDNVTRFIVLAREPLLSADSCSNDIVPAGKWKTSLVFSVAQGTKPGQLFKALSVFALRDIDLTKIESRPMRSQPLVAGQVNGSPTTRRFNYMFYVDFIGSLGDEHCQNALRHLKEICTFMRVLGSYPADTTL